MAVGVLRQRQDLLRARGDPIHHGGCQASGHRHQRWHPGPPAGTWSSPATSTTSTSQSPRTSTRSRPFGAGRPSEGTLCGLVTPTPNSWASGRSCGWSGSACCMAGTWPWPPAARIWTITATIELAGLNSITYLTAYLDACGNARGKPLTGSALESFLPVGAHAFRGRPAPLTWPSGPPHPDTTTPPASDRAVVQSHQHAIRAPVTQIRSRPTPPHRGSVSMPSCVTRILAQRKVAKYGCRTSRPYPALIPRLGDSPATSSSSSADAFR